MQRTKLVTNDSHVLLDPVGDINSLIQSLNSHQNCRLIIKDDLTRQGQKDNINDVNVYGVVLPLPNNFIQVKYYIFYPFNGNIFDVNKVKNILVSLITC